LIFGARKNFRAILSVKILQRIEKPFALPCVSAVGMQTFIFSERALTLSLGSNFPLQGQGPIQVDNPILNSRYPHPWRSIRIMGPLNLQYAADVSVMIAFPEFLLEARCCPQARAVGNADPPDI
jgi:hypothetical protein